MRYSYDDAFSEISNLRLFDPEEIDHKDHRTPFGHEPEHRSELRYPKDDENPASEPTKTELLIKALRDRYEARSRINKIIFDLRAQGIEVE